MRITDSQIHLHAPEHRERAARMGQRALLVDDALAQMDQAGVARAVVVAGAPESNEVALAAAAAHPDRFAVMGALNVSKPESRELIRTWRSWPGMLGIRLSFPPWHEVSWLSDGTADWLWPAAASLGIPVMLWPPDQLEHVARVARTWPDTTLIIDHLSLYVDVRDDEVATKVRPLLDLARYPNVSVKLSALPCHSTAGYPYRNLHQPIRDVIDAFGVQRAHWGTDLSRLPGTYREAITMFTEELDFLSGEDLEWVMGRGISSRLGWE